jgi:hypothetical protein
MSPGDVEEADAATLLPGEPQPSHLSDGTTSSLRLRLQSCHSHSRLIPALISSALLALLLLTVFVGLRHDRESGSDSLSLSSLLSVDERVGSSIRKIDERGRLLIWEGLTVIMPALNTAAASPHVEIYRLLSRDYAAYLTALPMPSYHVTLSSVTQRTRWSSQAEYATFMADHLPRLQRTKRLLKQETANLTFTVVAVQSVAKYVSPTLAPASEADRLQLHRLNELIAGSLGPLFELQERSHMSLAYRIPLVTVPDGQHAELEATLQRLYEGVELVVGPPRLCSFFDLTHFEPL